MSWGRIVILDSKLGAKVFEFQVVELLSIIRYQCFWDSEPAYYGEFALTSSNGQGPEYI